MLDVGCGLGNNLFYLRNQGFNAYGIDVSSTAVACLNSILNNNNLPSIATQADFKKMPFDDKTFDAVISVKTINHGDESEVRRGINEIERVLKPGGSIFITVPGQTTNDKIRFCLVESAEQIGHHTFIPTIGEETGIPHVIFDKHLIIDSFKNFEIGKIWKDSDDYYCFLGRKNRFI